MLDCNSKRPVLLSAWSKSRAPGWGRAFRWRSSLTHRGYLFCGGGLICGHVWKQICSVWPALAGGKSMRWLGERIEFLIKTGRFPEFLQLTSQPDNSTDWFESWSSWMWAFLGRKQLKWKVSWISQRSGSDRIDDLAQSDRRYKLDGAVAWRRALGLQDLAKNKSNCHYFDKYCICDLNCDMINIYCCCLLTITLNRDLRWTLLTWL